MWRQRPCRYCPWRGRLRPTESRRMQMGQRWRRAHEWQPGSVWCCGSSSGTHGTSMGSKKGRRWERKCGWRCRLGTMQIPNARRGTWFRQRPHSGKSLGICFVLSFLVSCVRVLDTKNMYYGCKELDEKKGCTHGHECPGSDPRLDTKIMLVDTDTSAQDLLLAIGVLKAGGGRCGGLCDGGGGTA
ncbi:putative classical arabinogalactan protein 9 [Iris pallida]|uniref:Classical arabinogalactan protein 9 n=1 Tax=Iris pallida TaxID=29817 RepID=A0AAX6GWU4_IRIPA|nr:putative classical arabinogalactan protein 9 [Iris pallida]